MKLKNRNPIQPRNGRAIHYRIGPLMVRAYYEFPPQSWKRFQMDVDIQVFNE
jgi:hypothetical protein